MALARLPELAYRGVVLDYDGLAYNPCDDLIFPSVVHAGAVTDRAPAPWLMYYAPHDPPGGICLAVADSVAGPWREFDGNPLVRNEWEPHHRVSHVSSPHVVWNAEEGLFFLYYHGENSTTRFATSRDGVTFEYGGVAVTEDAFPGATGAFYARVFRREEGTGAGRWAMLMMGHLMENDEAAIFCAWSDDGRQWTAVPEPLVRAGRGHSVCAPWLTRFDGVDVLLCHADRPMEAGGNRFDPHSDIVAYEVSEDLTEARRFGVLFSREAVSPENARVSDPCLLEDNGTLWLFHTIGSRLNQKIAVATAPCS